MANYKIGNEMDSNGIAPLNYRLSDAEWQLIMSRYEKHKSEFSLLFRSNVSKLIRSMAVSRTIITVQQAHLLLTLLLHKENVQEYENVEQTISCKGNAEVKAAADDTKITRINGIVEQLRLMIIQYQAHENCKVMCHDLINGRR